jgi:hypothetical protein
MPQSLPPTAVDHVAELEEIGQLLYDILLGVYVAPPEEMGDGDPVHELLAHVSQQTNIDCRNYKPSTIARRMAVTHSPTVSDYSAHVQTHRSPRRRRQPPGRRHHLLQGSGRARRA